MSHARPEERSFSHNPSMIVPSSDVPAIMLAELLQLRYVGIQVGYTGNIKEIGIAISEEARKLFETILADEGVDALRKAYTKKPLPQTTPEHVTSLVSSVRRHKNKYMWSMVGRRFISHPSSEVQSQARQLIARSTNIKVEAESTDEQVKLYILGVLERELKQRENGETI